MPNAYAPLTSEINITDMKVCTFLRAAHKNRVLPAQGTIVAVVCCNEHGFVNNTRFYQDGADLNRQFPGKPDGKDGSF